MRSFSVTFWAWTASIIVHIIVLATFGAVKFSRQPVAFEQKPAPVAKVSRIKKLMQTTPVTPKPKVKRPSKTRPIAKTITPQPLSTKQIFKTTTSAAQDFSNLPKPSASKTTALTTSEIMPKGIEFFGSYTDQRKLCYVVDCSGSMQGIFNRVRSRLTESIQSLQHDQYFNIIFFGSDRLFEFRSGELIRAMSKTKSEACDFIASIRPAGRTNALQALERAVKIHDGRGNSPAVIYFLTDGFELTNDDVRSFSQKVINLQKRFAPKTKINTIGFWPQNSDRKVLETIANYSGGESIFITDTDNWKDGL
ncbi:MAG: VWA domain-containing protein [Planctomycetes bacterium]|nr:VWA domain-containing protein [Planctomycetota bacterium]